MKDFASNKIAKQLLAAGVYATVTPAEVTGSSVDLKTALNGVIIVDLGAESIAGVAVNVKFQHSLDNSTFVDISTHNLTGVGFYVYPVEGLHGYVRLLYTVTGPGATGADSATLSATIIAWDAYYSPI